MTSTPPPPVAGAVVPDSTAAGATATAVAAERAEARAARRQRTLLGATTVLVLLLAWIVTARMGWVRPVALPKPLGVWDALVRVQTEGFRGHSLLQHLLISLTRVLVAFSIALVLAVPLGLLAGVSPKFEALLDPVINFLRVLPPLAYLFLLIIWLGIGETSKVTLLLLAAFPPIFIAVAQGVRRIPETRLEAARMLGARGSGYLRSAVLPSVLPDLFTGARVAIGFTYTTVVAAEIVAADSGIGWMTLTAYKFLQTDVVWVGMLVMGFTGIALDALVRGLHRHFVPWQGRA